MLVSLVTLGCKANQYDTEAIAECFRRAGCSVVPFPSRADVYIVNTCSVTGEAVRKSRQLARRAHRLNPEAVVVLTGCYAETGGDETALPGVTLVVGPRDRGRLVELVRNHPRDGAPRRVVRPPGDEPGFVDLPVTTFGEHTRAWLKIQDGCEQRCAFCQIPLARGPSRSLPLHRVVEEGRRLTDAGYQELVLTGIHLGAYGLDLPARPTLADVIVALDGLPDLARLRLGSVEPNDVTSSLIDALARSRVFAPHLHLPLQSGDDMVLARMHRPYRARDFAALIRRLRSSIAGLALSTDLLVGFPGETADQFEASLSFAAELGLSRLHVFPFSARPGTPAAAFPAQLPRAERAKRSRAAIALGERLALQFNRTLIGQELAVLVEDWRDGVCSGLAGQYAEVWFPSALDLRGRLVAVVGREATKAGLQALLSQPV